MEMSFTSIPLCIITPSVLTNYNHVSIVFFVLFVVLFFSDIDNDLTLFDLMNDMTFDLDIK